MHTIVVVNKPSQWNFQIPDVEVVAAKAYLTDSIYSGMRNARIFNLCQSYRYQGLGYYVSLLAEARGHRCFPNITTIQDLKSQSIIKIISDELDQRIQHSLSRLKSNDFDLNIYFGKSVAKQYEQLSKQLHNLFPVPLLHARFQWNQEQNKWLLQNIFPLTLNQLPKTDKTYLLNAARKYFARKHIRSTHNNSKLVYDIAILVNPKEKFPPSNKKAIDKFLQAAEAVGMRAKIISKNDYSRIPEFDALFIRETTAVNHHTYRFARRALAENLVVIDDPISIVRCANKVYMAEVMKKAHIPIPKTLIIHNKNNEELIEKLGAPYILKQPDGSFSNGVVKVDNPLTLDEELHRFLNQSELVIAQEYVPTEYDWRIGILDKLPLFACKYYMVKNHWQINKWQDNDTFKEGRGEAVPLKAVPSKVLKLAQKAAALIGNGFYGVDLKQIGNNFLVIEINDNPNIETGVEDNILKDDLYAKIMQHILYKIKQKKENHG
jgi:glutathione synthase/RimK-type ligase-like ATP-grasp enzyme